MKAILGLLVLVLAGSDNAFAQSKDIAYNCVGDAAGGPSYNEKTKKWEATPLVPFQKFVTSTKA